VRLFSVTFLSIFFAPLEPSPFVQPASTPFFFLPANDAALQSLPDCSAQAIRFSFLSLQALA